MIAAMRGAGLLKASTLNAGDAGWCNWRSVLRAALPTPFTPTPKRELRRPSMPPSMLDAAKLPNLTGLNLVSLVDSERLAIDGRSAFTATTTIPLVLSVPAAGTYSLNASALNNLSMGLSPYLRTTRLVRLCC